MYRQTRIVCRVAPLEFNRSKAVISSVVISIHTLPGGKAENWGYTA